MHIPAGAPKAYSQACEAIVADPAQAAELTARANLVAVVSNGTAAQVVLTVTSHDDGSGVATLNGSIEGPVPPVGEVPKIFFSAQSDPNHADAPTLVTIVVPQHAAAGIWRVGVIRLTDKSGNMRAYERGDPVLANAYFTVE